jgi:hypothetical protein
VTLRATALALTLALGAASAALASCPGGYCLVPSVHTPSQGQQSAFLLASADGHSAARADSIFGASTSAPLDQGLDLRFSRSPHPFVRAQPLPDPESLDPLTRLSFLSADIQVAKLIGQDSSHVRRAEFHTAADANGNTFSASSTRFSISLPLACASLALVLLSVSLAIPFLSRQSASPARVPLLPDTPAVSAVPSTRADDQDSVHVIEWEDPIMDPPQYVWADLVRVCCGDVMAAASAINAQVEADPSLDPGSPEAFKRAILSLSSKQSTALA